MQDSIMTKNSAAHLATDGTHDTGLARNMRHEDEATSGNAYEDLLPLLAIETTGSKNPLLI